VTAIDELEKLLAKSHYFAEHLLGMFGEDMEWFSCDRPEAAAAASRAGVRVTPGGAPIQHHYFSG